MLVLFISVIRMCWLVGFLNVFAKWGANFCYEHFCPSSDLGGWGGISDQGL